MFTGLVEALGTVAKIVPEDSALRLLIDVPLGWSDEPGGEVGASVAVNGCCLTLVEAAEDRWSFQAGEETLDKTSLGRLKQGEAVNLERPLRADGRLGGHFVQGHVDGLGRVASLSFDGEWTNMSIRVPGDLTRLIVPKGSVAVDGVSLTVVELEDDSFSVALIPHTLEVTTLGRRRVGDEVNIETDILGKYVEKLLRLT